MTLEPCSHFGKTPPCSDLIIKHKIPNVVIGCTDDNPEVAGKGVEKLKANGCNVILGVLENECRTHHKRFFTFHNKKRPYIILKWAESADGFIAPSLRNEQKPVWITNEASRQLVHKWRAEEHAILVGTTTVLEDNPSLTVRSWTGQNPIRIVLDRTQKLPSTLQVFNDEAQTISISSNDINFDANVAHQIGEFLFNNNIQSVIIEGGTTTLQTFIDENIWDEARLFKGPIQFKDGVKAPQFKGNLISEEALDTDILKFYKNDL